MEYEDYDNLKQIQKSLQKAIRELDHVVCLADRIHLDVVYDDFIVDVYLCLTLCNVFESMIKRIDKVLEWEEQKWDE
ncbi:MAG: hypothetical protein ACTSYJ_06320 [Candidatus Thorarchaeota archaeon]